jgi:hypothetical protein
MIATKAYHPSHYDMDYHGGHDDQTLGYDTMISRVGAGS